MFRPSIPTYWWQNCLLNRPWLANCFLERCNPSATLTGVFHLCHHWRTDMSRITGNNVAIPAGVYLLGLGGRTKMSSGFCNFPAGWTCENSYFLCFCGFGFFLFRNLRHERFPFVRSGCSFELWLVPMFPSFFCKISVIHRPTNPSPRFRYGPPRPRGDYNAHKHAACRVYGPMTNIFLLWDTFCRL